MIALSIALTLAVSVGVFPQNARPSKYGKHSTIFYDKFKDTTTVTTETPRVAGAVSGSKTSGAAVTLSATAVYEGKGTDKLKDLFLRFHALERGWHFLKPEERALIILLDGERIVVGTASLDDSHVGGDNTAMSAAIGGLETGRLSGISTRLVTEDMSLPIPRGLFLKLKTAKTVEMQLGAVEWKLKAEHQKYFAELPLGDPAPTRP